jgi:hypothetical protein
MSKERIKDLPHTTFLDLVKIHCVVVKSDKEGVFSIIITSEIAESGVSV